MITMMTPGLDDKKLYGDSRIATMIQTMFDKSISEIFNLVQFTIRLRQAIDEFVSSLRYEVKVTKELLNTDELIKLVAHVIKTEADKVIKARSKNKEKLKRFAQAAEKTASDRSSPLSESPPTGISDDRTNNKTYLITESDEQGR